MIVQDVVSRSLTLMSSVLVLLLYPYGISTDILVYLGLMASISMGFMFYGFKRQPGESAGVEMDVDVTEREAWGIAKYTVMSLALMLLVASYINYKPFPNLALDATPTLLLGFCFAVFEEQFFRGFWTETYYRITGDFFIPSLLSGAMFAIFHFAVYGTDPNKIIFVLASGFILSFFALRSRRVSPVMLAHIGVNLIASGATIQ